MILENRLVKHQDIYVKIMKTTKGLYVFLAIICFLGAASALITTFYLMIVLNYDKSWWNLMWVVAILGGSGYGAIEEIKNIEEDES